MSRKRKKPSGSPQKRPGSPREPVLLDTSTTETNFLYFAQKPGVEPPSETMRMVGEVASERDRLWFAEHPEATYRVRWSLPGEYPTDGMELMAGSKLSEERGRFVMVVLQLRPGARRRIPTIFIDGGHTSRPIPEEIWGEFYEAATAEDMDAAVRALAVRLADGRPDV